MIARATVSSVALLALLAGPVAAQEVTLGVPAPLTGSREILGRQVVDGVRAGAGADASIVEADTACSAEGGAAAARALVEAEIAIAVGFLCAASLESALPILAQAEIPSIVVGVRANRITDDRPRTRFPVWRLGPRSDAEAEALAAFVAENWRGEAFGIVEDGSAYARDLADEVRARLSAQTIEPALVDNFRPAEDRQFAIGRRILQSGVTRVLILGTRRDTAIIARDAAELDLDLEIVGGETLIDEPASDVELPDGIRAVGIANTIPPEDADRTREGYFAPAHAAAEIARLAIERADAEGRTVGAVLADGSFETTLGTIEFDDNGDSNWRAFGVLVFDGARFVPAPES